MTDCDRIVRSSRRRFDCGGRLAWMVLVGVVLLIAGAGCEAVKHAAQSLGPDAPAGPVEPMFYPADAPIDQPLNVQVVRISRRHVRLTNLTASSLGDLTVYFNQQYGGVVEQLPAGRSIEVALADFVNAHGERYPVGSLLEPDKSRVLLLADAVVDGRLRKMNVRLADDWQQP